MSGSSDLVVIGAGPGGYVAAIRAAQLGMRTTIVERSHLGGICLNWGCIPTKALLKAGELYESVSDLGRHGVESGAPTFELSKIVQRSRDVAKQLSTGVSFLMKKHKIEVVDGVGRLEAGHGAPRVIIEMNKGGTRTLEPNAVIVATGARPRLIPSLGMVPDGERIWTYREAMVPSSAPASLIVIGSGAIGIEFASFYRALGADVTVVEARDRILPVEDLEVSAAAQKAFEKRGIKFRVGVEVTELVKRAQGVTAVLAGEGSEDEQLTAEVALFAVGVEGNVEGLGLEGLGVRIEKGHIETTADGATNVPGLFAIGDVAGPPWLAHKASHEGVRCVEHLAGMFHRGVEAPVPSCTYSQPQIASVGITEAEAQSKGIDVKIGRFPFKFNGRAISAGDTDGFVKTIFDASSGQLLGAHMLGAEVTEMIQGFCLAMTLKATEAEISATIFPHPTMSEAMHEAALAAAGKVLHM